MRKATLSILFTLVLSSSDSEAQSLWQPVATMAHPRRFPTTTLLADGRVLVANGTETTTYTGATSTAEIYSPLLDSWTEAASLPARQAARAVRLLNGNVLVVGGVASGTYLTDAHFYDAATNAWTDAGSTAGQSTAVPTGATLTLLASGKVLLAGGLDTSGTTTYATVYDPAANSWTPTVVPMTRGRTYHEAVPLSDGRVLVIGGLTMGSGGDTVLSDCEIYDPGGNSWSASAPMDYARVAHRAVRLADGRVMVAGGDNYAGDAVAITEIFSPETKAWTPAGEMLNPRLMFGMQRLPSGHVLAVGGTLSGEVLDSAELFDPVTEGWAPTQPLAEARRFPETAVLDDGTVLVLGGAGSSDNTLATAERFVSLPAGARCDSGGECASGACAAGVCCDSTCDGPCEACGDDGICRDVSAGEDPKGSCEDEGAETCGLDGTCDGQGSCAVYAPESPCAPSVCAPPSETGYETARCDAAGPCVHATVNCEPYRCDLQGCIETCASIDDCAAPNLCGVDGRCAPPPGNSPQAVDEGCGCAVPGTTRETSLKTALLALALASLVARRRSRRRHRKDLAA
jgi:MYXO-CTERM domain-containing protein